MKKIVAFVFPVSEPAPSNSSNGVVELADNGAAEGLAASDSRAMKVEVTVSDAQAKRILSELVECGSEMAEPASLDVLVQKQIDLVGSNAPDLFERILVDVERRVISRVYEDCHRIKTKTAARLGIDRNTLHKKLRQYNLIHEGDEVA